jgi:hypothetical protein
MARQHVEGFDVAVLVNAQRPCDFANDDKKLQEAVDRALAALAR